MEPDAASNPSPLEGTPVLGFVEDGRLAMRAARLWCKMIDVGIVPDPGSEGLRMLGVSAFVIAATACAPESRRVRPVFGGRLRTQTEG